MWICVLDIFILLEIIYLLVLIWCKWIVGNYDIFCEMICNLFLFLICCMGIEVIFGVIVVVGVEV